MPTNRRSFSTISNPRFSSGKSIEIIREHVDEAEASLSQLSIEQQLAATRKLVDYDSQFTSYKARQEAAFVAIQNSHEMKYFELQVLHDEKLRRAVEAAVFEEREKWSRQLREQRSNDETIILALNAKIDHLESRIRLTGEATKITNRQLQCKLIKSTKLQNLFKITYRNATIKNWIGKFRLNRAVSEVYRKIQQVLSAILPYTHASAAQDRVDGIDTDLAQELKDLSSDIKSYKRIAGIDGIGALQRLVNHWLPLLGATVQGEPLLFQNRCFHFARVLSD